MEPLVSVVIPYYQHKQYIDNCISSVVQQTYESIELIIVDDCSPDGSGNYVQQILQNQRLLQRFSNKINFIHLDKNQGAHFAINHGISQSNGEYIAILNSDDLYHPDRLRSMISLMKKEQKEFAFSGVNYMDDNGKSVDQSDGWVRIATEIQEKIEEFPTIGFACLVGNPGISTGNFVFTKNLSQSTFGFRDIKFCHDWDFLLQCICYTEPLFIRDKLYYYRVHENNTFKILQKDGTQIDDTAYVLKHYFDSVRLKKTVNPLAPSPFNWPGYFDLFISLYKYEEHYKKSIYLNT